MYQYRIHRITISKFIPEVCNAIYDALSSKYMLVPFSENEWLEIMKRTNERWPFTNSCAVADGKQVGIICPNHAGSEYYNYKGFYSVVLLKFVDYDYKFLIAEAGC